MLTIVFGEVERAIYNTAVFFKNSFEPEWLEKELAKEMILDVDRSEVLSPYCIQSPVLGQIPPEMLSGGVKTLLLILNRTDKIAEYKDITINLRHVMKFGREDFPVPVWVEGQEVHNMKELLPLALNGIDSMEAGVVK